MEELHKEIINAQEHYFQAYFICLEPLSPTVPNFLQNKKLPERPFYKGFREIKKSARRGSKQMGSREPSKTCIPCKSDERSPSLILSHSGLIKFGLSPSQIKHSRERKTHCLQGVFKSGLVIYLFGLRNGNSNSIDTLKHS